MTSSSAAAASPDSSDEEAAYALLSNSQDAEDSNPVVDDDEEEEARVASPSSFHVRANDDDSCGLVRRFSCGGSIGISLLLMAICWLVNGLLYAANETPCVDDDLKIFGESNRWKALESIWRTNKSVTEMKTVRFV